MKIEGQSGAERQGRGEKGQGGRTGETIRHAKVMTDAYRSRQAGTCAGRSSNKAYKAGTMNASSQGSQGTVP